MPEQPSEIVDGMSPYADVTKVSLQEVHSENVREQSLP
jgi:hypothetical protein